MRIISILLFVCFSILLHAQVQDSSKVLITGNCYGNAQTNQLTKGLTGKVIGLNMTAPPADTSKPKIFIRCGYRKLSNQQPLLIVDGLPQKLAQLGSMNPNDIASIEIVKGSAALAIYGSQGENGVIIVTTKKTSSSDLIIKDSADGKAIAGATVSFISADKKDTMMYVADENGIVTLKETRRILSGDIAISAIGYKTHEQHFDKNSPLGTGIVLSPDIKPLDAIIVDGGVCRGIRCFISSCRQAVTSKKRLIKGGDSAFSNEEGKSVRIFPNPMMRGASFNISLKEDQNRLALVKLYSLNGNLVLQQNIVKGSVLQTVRTDARWAAGVYFVQLVYENGRVAASERIIIQ